jgi:hypothetical protein
VILAKMQSHKFVNKLKELEIKKNISNQYENKKVNEKK